MWGEYGEPNNYWVINRVKDLKTPNAFWDRLISSNEISAWCPVSDTADTEERRESGLKLDVKFLKGAFLWIFANSWERERKISVHSPHPLKLILCCSFWLEPVSKVPVLGRWPRTEVKEIRSRPKGVPDANSLPASSWLEGACCCQASRGRWCWFKGSTARCRIGGNGGGNIHLGCLALVLTGDCIKTKTWEKDLLA